MTGDGGAGAAEAPGAGAGIRTPRAAFERRSGGDRRSGIDRRAALDVPGGSGKAATEAAAPTPPPVVATVPRPLHEQLIDWARHGYPNEACGILSGERAHADGGTPDRFHPMANAAASPSRYLMDSAEQLHVLLELDDADRVVWGIFHSHVRTPAEPSPTDVRLAAFPDGQPTFPNALYLICSLADTDAPVVRAWSIVAGRVLEVPIELGD